MPDIPNHNELEAQGALHPTEGKIISFREFVPGWCYGEGVPFEKQIIDDALSLNQEALRIGFPTTDAFPGPNGEIMFTIYCGDHYLELTIEPGIGTTLVREQSGREVQHEQGLLLNDAKDRIRRFGEELL